MRGVKAATGCIKYRSKGEKDGDGGRVLKKRDLNAGGNDRPSDRYVKKMSNDALAEGTRIGDWMEC